MIDNRLPAAQRASVADTIHTRALARAAEAQGSTQSLAGLLHVPENTLLRWMSGRAQMPVQAFLKLVEMLVQHEKNGGRDSATAAHINGEKRVFRNFEQIGAIAREMHAALESGKWDDVARLLGEEWKLRRTNAPGITTPLIDKLIAVAKRKGALAAKVCGAGGGGCFVLFVREGSHEKVAEATRKNGGRVLPFRVNPDGVTVVSGAAKEFRVDTQQAASSK